MLNGRPYLRTVHLHQSRLSDASLWQEGLLSGYQACISHCAREYEPFLTAAFCFGLLPIQILAEGSPKYHLTGDSQDSGIITELYSSSLPLVFSSFDSARAFRLPPFRSRRLDCWGGGVFAPGDTSRNLPGRHEFKDHVRPVW